MIKIDQICHESYFIDIAVTRIRTWVVAATTQSTNHYTITATYLVDSVHIFINISQA